MKKNKRFLRVLMAIVFIIGGTLTLNAIPNEKNNGNPPQEKSRSYPSIFQAWNGIENKPDEDDSTRLARHDLVFSHPYSLFEVYWAASETQPYSGLSTSLGGNLSTARQKQKALITKNPNMRFLVEIRYRDAKYVSSNSEGPNWWETGFYPPDSPYWLKDSRGKPVIGWGEDTNADEKIDENDEVLHFLIDFTAKEVQNIIAEKALALKNSGLFDGVMLDWWSEDFATSPIGPSDWSETILSWEEERNARLSILQKIRAKVGDDFLILVNANQRKIPQSAPYVNGIFMESYKKKYNKGYTRDEVLRIESTLLWAERHLKAPQINCLEGWRVVTDYTGDLSTRIAERNNEENRRWMRMITTLSLTHSDGYVLFADDNAIPTPDHLHNWYDFWDAHLWGPIGEKSQNYQGVDGLFIRRFENGWAVYNRSGSTQTVTFDQAVTGVNSGEHKVRHQVADFDGEIFLIGLAKG